MRTITLTSLDITRIELDYVQSRAVVWFDIKDNNGITREQGVAYFWVTMPPTTINPATGLPNPQPDNYFQLPSTYFATLVSLQNDADTALTLAFLS